MVNYQSMKVIQSFRYLHKRRNQTCVWLFRRDKVRKTQKKLQQKPNCIFEQEYGIEALKKSRKIFVGGRRYWTGNKMAAKRNLKTKLQGFYLKENCFQQNIHSSTRSEIQLCQNAEQAWIITLLQKTRCSDLLVVLHQRRKLPFCNWYMIRGDDTNHKLRYTVVHI